MTLASRSRHAQASWILALLLALALHAWFFYFPKIEWTGAAKLPPRVDLEPMDAKKLDQIRSQWKKQALLMGVDQPKSEEAPKDARYMSDRNIRVEKEQRAKSGDILPERQKRVRGQERKAERTLPKLGNLGVRIKIAEAPKPQSQANNTDGTSSRNTEQLVLDDDVPTGGQNLLNAQQSVFYSFFARMREAVGPIWRSRLGDLAPALQLKPGDYITRLHVMLDSDGYVRDVEIEQGSGITELDRAAENAFRKAERFANPPKELVDRRGEVHFPFGFLYRIGGNGIDVLTVPPRYVR